MSIRRDYRRRRSFSYRFKRWFNVWFWEDHTEGMKTIVKIIGEIIITFLWLGALFFFPHLFH